MARVTITRVWPDGDQIHVTVRAATSYPDALAEAKRIALDGFAEAVGVVLTPEDES